MQTPYDVEKTMGRHFAIHSFAMQNKDGNTVSTNAGTSLLYLNTVPLLPEPFKPHGRSPTHCEIRDAGPGRGKGMYATCDIATGSLIVVERPAIVVPVHSDVDMEKGMEVLCERLSTHSPELLEETLQLSNCKPAKLCGTKWGILRKNGVGVDLPLPRVNARVVAHLFHAHFNSGPNTTHFWDLPTCSISVYTTRHVAKNEEFTFQYTEITAPRDERRRILKNSYLFDCDCQFCDTPDLSASDARRAEATAIYGSLNKSFDTWSSDLSLPDDHLLTSLRRELKLVKEEGLEMKYYLKFATFMWQVYIMLGNEKQAKIWGSKALACTPVLTGKDTHTKEKVEQMSSPQNVDYWNVRKLKQAALASL